MDHLQEFKVGFIGSVARSFEGNKYYQNAFTIDGKSYQAKSAEDYTGRCGIVQFLKKGEALNGGSPIVNDCFTIKMVTTASAIAAAKAAALELAATAGI